MSTVSNVYNYVKLSESEITKIISDNNDKLKLTSEELTRWHKKCLCLVEFNNVKNIDTLKFQHQNNTDDWLILENIEDVLEGSSKKYNYDLAKFK